uniref:ATP synthase complex subunit 8 n=1 Tax=Pediacus ater TaxID=2528282 RepID=A0A7G7MTM8_9CUCU|nr:ATP synthase F0 subunit 8 [Pediacus ater]
MPQMAPLNWIILFFYFSMIFIMFNSLNYFSFKYKIKKSNPLTTSINYIWKW